MGEPESTDLAVVEPPPLPKAFEPTAIALLSETEFRRRVDFARLEIERLHILKKEILIKDVDFGRIPNTDKDTLFQPGAQKLNQLYSLRAVYRHTRIIGTYYLQDGKEVYTTPPLAFELECDLVDPSGRVVSTGIGEANSWEKKHRYRYANRTCPHCQQQTVLASKHDEGTYFCWKNKGGCGANFKSPEAIELIESQPLMSENPDPHDLANTLLKMGGKRALLAATLAAHAASGLFTQDADELPPRAETDAAERHEGGRSTTAAPRRAPDEGAADEGAATAGQVSLMRGRTKRRLSELEQPEEDAGRFEETIAALFSTQSYEDIPKSQVDAALAEIDQMVIRGS